MDEDFHPNFSFSELVRNNEVRGSNIVTNIRDIIKRFPFNNLRRENRYDFDDWREIVPKDALGRVIGNNFIDDNITEDDYETNMNACIPRVLWNDISAFGQFVAVSLDKMNVSIIDLVVSRTVGRRSSR